MPFICSLLFFFFGWQFLSTFVSARTRFPKIWRMEWSPLTRLLNLISRSFRNRMNKYSMSNDCYSSRVRHYAREQMTKYRNHYFVFEILTINFRGLLITYFTSNKTKIIILNRNEFLEM